MAKKRGLSERFMKDIKDVGPLHPLLTRLRGDTTLDLQIRENYLNIYYRGGSLLRVAPVPRRPSTYVFDFNTNYTAAKTRTSLDLPNPTVLSIDGVEAWERAIPRLKDTMDLWFGKHPKDERALQQMVVWENNDCPWANGTDYFILDIEYDSRKGDSNGGGRFDLIALRWDSDSTSRKLNGTKRPKLVIIEMKAGDGALKGKAGLQDHVKAFETLSKSRGKAGFRQEMATVFAQKRELGLIRSLVKNKNQVDAQTMDPEIEFMFLLAGHDPASKKLGVEVNALATDLPITVCTANFMGYGLYKENVQPLPDFAERLTS